MSSGETSLAAHESAFDPGCVKTWNIAKGRESASQMPRRRSSICSSRSRSSLLKEYFSLQFAPRCVFTQPRPGADIWPSWT